MMAKINQESVIRGILRSIPIAVLGIIDAIIFGILARSASLSFVESVLMSGLVASGTAQFLALQMWREPLPVISLLFSTLLVNLRYLMLGATLNPIFANRSGRLVFPTLFFFFDENWALTTQEMRKGSGDVSFFLGSGAAIYFSWVCGTAAGYLLGGEWMQLKGIGLEFAFVVIFAAITADHWNGKSTAMPWTVAAAAALITQFLIPGEWYIFVGAITGSLVAVFANRNRNET